MTSSKLKTILLSLSLLACAPALAHGPTAGLWFSPDHNGHGFDLQKIGDQYIVVFYTFSDDQQPVWYFSVADEVNGQLKGSFSLFEYQPGQTPPQQLLREPGEFTIDFVNTGAESACSDAAFPKLEGQIAVLAWTVDDAQGSWCVKPLLPQAQSVQQDFTALWWAGAQDQGWGLSLDYAGEGPLRTEVIVLFYFDRNGFPRWAFGSTGSGGANSEVPMQNFTGYCIDCPVVDIQPSVAGSISHFIQIIDGKVMGSVDLDISYALPPGGDWIRNQSPLIPLSESLPGLLPLPETVLPDQSLAIIDTTLIPMTDGYPVMPHQSLLVENGVITSIAPADEFVTPNDALIIDARGLFVAPGMSEMHMHISVGGEAASEQAGLFMIANGITTALNMGNSFDFDIPGLGDRFESGELIGPSFYTGQVAYGPADNSDPTLTVSNGPEATAYAEALKNQGFDFIKTYWQLPGSAIRRFQTESARLDLPLIGHIPLRQSMNQSMANGHEMAAHIQEPYVSFMGSVRDDSLFQGAANIFLTHGSYLTPTLAVFESYVKISGPRRGNFNELVAREGVEYQPPSITDAWEAYYNINFIQNGDAANLDDLLAFYYRMAKFFFDAGVPLLNGTDSPGFPGVMSGFGAIEEMRLLNETGIPARDVFAIATRNAGQFIDETLNPDISFGTLEIGKRADLIVTLNNPLESVDHVKRPLAVMARGRFWSQTYLEAELNRQSILMEQQNSNNPQDSLVETLDFSPHH